MAARVGVGRVGGARAAELGIELDVAADVGDHDEGRPALGSGQGAGVLVGLVVGAQHGLVPAGGIEGPAGLLGFADEGTAAVEVDVAAADAAVGLADVHPALEHVAVVAGVAAGRLGRGQIEQGGEFGKEELVVGALAAPAPSQRAMKASSAEGVGREAGAGQAAAEVTRGSRVSVGKR